MAQMATISQPPYGASELKRVAQKWMAVAIAAAGLFHVAAGVSYQISERLGREEAPVHTVRVVKYSELGPPPSISTANAPAAIAVAMPTAQVKPSVGVPVPVADEEVAPEQTIATQQEMAAPVGDEFGEGTGGLAIEQDLDVDNIMVQEDEAPPDFVPFEKEPQVVKRVEPVFPEAARAAGLEGKVWAKLWIDKEGRVREVIIVKTPSEMFNQAVIDAAKQWVFTPAVMNSGPVAVWMPVSFEFRFNN